MIDFVGLNSLIFAQQGNWEIIGEMLRPVAGGSEFVDSKNIYILGGYSDSTQNYVNWIQKYSTFLFIWKLNVFMKKSRYGLIGSNYDNTFYYFGGINNLGAIFSSLEFWKVGQQPTIINTHFNFSRVFSTGLIKEGKFYIIGGNQFSRQGSSDLPYISEYDIIGETFTYENDSILSNPELPEQQMSALHNDDIFILGGVTNGISNKIFRFNTVTHEFEELLLTLLEPRAAGRGIKFESTNEIFIIGGYNEGNDALNSVEILTINDTNYDIKSGPSLNVARSHFMAAYLEDAIYVFGGYDENGDLVTQIEKYSPITTDVNDGKIEIAEFRLNQNYPNPFNPSTTISYQLPVNSFVTIKVYNILGNEVATLVNEQKTKGKHTVKFHTNSEKGGLPSGIYFYTLSSTGKTGNNLNIKKMVLIK
jgi:N-acetylneuraminic acid mutarotase